MYSGLQKKPRQPPAPEPGVAPAEGLQDPPRGTTQHHRSRYRVARRDRLPRRSKEVRLARVHLHVFRSSALLAHKWSSTIRLKYQAAT